MNGLNKECSLPPPADARGIFYPEDGGDTSIQPTSTRRHILEDGILHSHHREIFKSYIRLNEVRFYLARETYETVF
jgi:hypothetical protein